MAKLVLENNEVFTGTSFGYEDNIAGEVVFSTNMSGYIESFTDPSFCDQILCLTYPLIGNYGIPSKRQIDQLLTCLESSKIQISGLIVTYYNRTPNHWNCHQSLEQWMISENIPGFKGVLSV